MTVDGDATDEANETVVLRLSSPVNATLSNGGTSLDATGTITDDDAAPAVSVADADAVAEGDDPDTTADMSFAVALSAASGRIVTVPYTLGGTAKAGADYAGDASGTLTIAPGNAGGSIVVAVKGDVVDEPNETVVVTLGVPTNATVSTAEGAGTAEGEITDDDDPPAVSVGDAAAVTEGDDPDATVDMSFPVSLSRASGKTVTLPYSLGGTADAGSDYTEPDPRSITIQPGSASASILIPVKGDTLHESNETITLSLDAPANATIATTPGAGTASGTITDNEGAPTASLILDPTTIDERGAGNVATVTASLSGASNEQVTLSVSAPAGAVALSENKTLIIAPGETGSTGTVTVTATDNSADAADAEVTVSATATAGRIAGDAGAVLTVRDDEPTAVTLSASTSLIAPGTVTITERVAAHTATLTLALARDLAPGEIAEVPLALSSATGAVIAATSAAARDFTLRAGGTGVSMSARDTAAPKIRFTGGAGTERTATLTITPTSRDDGDTAQDRVRIRLGDLSAATLATNLGGGLAASDDGLPSTQDNQVWLNIQDHKPAGVTISHRTLAHREGDRDISYTLVLDQDPRATVTIDLTSDDPGAARVIPETLTFTSTGAKQWNLSQRVVVRADVDGDLDSETVTMTHTVKAPQGNPYNGLAADPVTVSVTDLGRGLTLVPPAVSVRANGGTATYRVHLNSRPTADVTVTPTSQHPSFATVDGPRTFAAATWTHGGSIQFEVTGVGEGEAAINHVTSSRDAGYDGKTWSTLAVTVNPDPRLPIGLTAANSVAEGANLTLTASIDAARSAAIDVPLVYTNGSAEAADYTQVTSIRIPAGKTSAQATVAIADDTTYEGDETFTVAIGALPEDQRPADPAGIAVTIDDAADAPSFGFSAASGTVAEDIAAGKVTLTVEKTGTTLVPATLGWATADGTAKAGSDYSAVAAGSLVFAAGDTSKTLQVSLTDDSTDEPSEGFRVDLSATSHARLGAPASHGVTITDDDPTSVTLSALAGAIAEATGSKVLTVTLGRALVSGESLSVPLTFGGAAAFGGDYTLAAPSPLPAGVGYAHLSSTDLSKQSPTVTFTGGTGASSSATLTLTATQDTTDEGAGETVEVGLSDLDGNSGTGLDGGAEESGTATFTITDDDAAPGGIALSVSPLTVAEDAAGAQTVTVTATVTGTTTYAEDKVVAVRVGESTDSATSGTDYTAVPGFDITIRAGTSSGEGEFDLDPADDNLDEPGETLTVAGASGALTVTPARVTITDDDVPQVGITPGPAVTEGTAARFTVSADIAPAADLAVVLNVTGRGAFAASGATGDGKTVTLSKGATSVTYEVATLADAVDEADGAVTAALAAGTGYGIVAGQQTATVGVSDDDRTVVTLARPGTDGVAENGGTLDVTLTLGRALVAGESVVAPLAVTGATVATHYTLALKGNGGTGVSLSTAAPHSAQHPAVTLAGVGARTATLVLTAKPNADRLTRTVGIAYGTGDRRPSASGLSGGITLAGAPLSVVLVDDDAMVTVAAARAAEGSVLEFAVTLPDPAPAGGVTIDYATADGRGEAADKAYQVAVASEDYTAAGGNARLTIAKDGTGGTIRITTLEDAVYEGDHHLTLTLESSTHFNISATAGSAAGTIDDAADAPSFGFSAASGTVAEDIAAGKVTLTVEKTGTTLVPATLGWATADGTAKAGSDYSAVAAGSLVFAAGDTSKTLQVSLTDDSTDEPSEGFRVDLSATSHARLGAPASHGVTITDDDPTSVTLSAPSGAIAEATGSKVLTVTLGRALVSGESLSVPLTFGGAAAFGGDYTLAAPSPLPAGVGYAHLASTDLSKQSPTVTFTGGAGASSSATLTLTATQDTTDEGAGETVEVGLSDLDGNSGTGLDGGAEESGTATFTITDDDAAPGGIALSVSPLTVAEDAAGAQTVTVTATVTGTTTYAEDKVVAVRVGESTDSATSGTDYTAVPGFDITIRAGTSSGEGEFDLDPADDNLDEPGETLTVAGASGALTVTPARVTITDDDVPQVGITPGPAVTEGTAARFTVSADIAPAADLAVVLNVTGRGAFAASGATGDGKTVTLSKGATSVTYEVATLADAVDEADGAVTAALAAGTGYGIVAGQQTATVGVSDDDRTVVTLARPGTDGVAENGGTLDVTLTLGRALVAGESVVAPLAVTGATVATHYTLALKGNGGTGVSLSTAAPHSAQHPAVTLAGVGARTATLVLTAKPNADRLTRTVGIAYGTGDRRPSASGLSGGITLAGAPLSVVLVDDDAMVTVAAARAAEGSVLEFAVTLPDPAPAGGVTIDYATADGRGEAADKAYQVAVASEDYTAAGGNARLTIAKDGTGGTIRITTLEDAVYEGDHHLTLTLESSTHFNISATAGSAAGTIDDAADAPSFGFSAASGTVAEDIAAGKVTLTVEKTGTTLVPATLGWATADGTAKAGSDYSAVAAGSLVFAAGDTSKTLQVSLTDDSTDEPSEGFRVDLSATSHARLGAPASHGVTITDDDPTSVTLSAPSGAIAEATGSKVLTVTLGRALVSGESLSVPLTFGGAAAFGGDYTLAAPSPLPAGVGYAHLASTDLSKQSPTVTFTGGAGASSSATLTLTATQDTTDEGAGETVEVGLSDLDGNSGTGLDGGAEESGTATFTITDDDAAPGGVTLSVDPSSVGEGAAATKVTVTATVTGGTAYPDAKTVTVSVGAGTDAATEGTDYAQVADFAITIAGGATTAQGSFTLAPADDDVDEEAGEAVSVTGVSGALTVTPTTLILADDDARGVTVAPEAVTVREADDAGTADVAEHEATYTVVLDSEPTGGTVTVSVASGATGTATVSPASLEFDATDWKTPKTVTVTGVDDDVDNAGDRRAATITHSLSAAGTDYESVTAAPVAVTVTDDDAAPGGVTLSVDVATVAEDAVTAATVTVTATVTGGTAYAEDKVVAVTVGESTDTATSGTDYTAVPGFDITIPAEDTSAAGSFALDPTDDNLDEPGETVTVAGTLSGVTVTGTSVTITDDDALPVLSIDSPTVTEGNAATVTLRYTVSLSPASGRSVTVAYADTGTGTATSATDYAAVTAGTLAFAAGETSKTLDVTVDGDATDEANETVVLRLSAPVNATLSNGGASLDATGTITDDDAAPAVSVADADAVAEGDDPDTTADMSFAVALSAASGRIVTVPYTLGGTAKAGADYAGDASGTLTIAPGNAGGSIVVAVKGDVVDEPNETVVVTLGVPTNATVSTAEGAGTAEGEITDDEATPTATLTLAPAAIDESGATNASTVTAALSGASSEVVTLAVSTSGAAHTLSQGKTLTIAAGEKASTGTVTVTATDNDVDAAADATVTVSATASGGGVAAPADVTLTVRDDDVRAVRVSKSTVTVREADDAVTADVAEHEATYTVVLDSEPTGGTVTVNVASGAAGTATVSPASLEFDATDWSTAQVVTVTGVDDDVDNAGDRRAATITHTVSAGGTDYATETASPVSVTVTDDDGPPTGITLSVDVDSVAEGATSAATVTVTATVAGGSAFDAARTVTVSVGQSADTATEGTDYAQVADFDITIPKGAKSATGSFDLTPADDDVDEGTGETVGVAGTSGSLPVTPATVTITDDDERGVTVTPVALTLDEADDAATDSVTENAGEYTVKLDSRPTANVVIDLSAGNGAPVTLDKTRLTFTPSSWNDAQTVTVTAIDDSFDNPGDERTASITHTISAGTSDYGSVSAAPVSVTVSDDDDAVSAAALSVNTASVAENAGATEVTVTATLAGTTRFATERKIRVTVGQAGDAAVSGTDYQPVAAFDVTIAPDQASGSASFTLTPTDDKLDEDDEALTLSGVLSGVTVGDAAVTVTDDDAAPGGVTLSVDVATVAEDAVTAATVTVTATVTGGTAYAEDKVVAVTVGESTDTATSGTDYTAVPGFDITIPAEDTSAAGSFALDPTDDNLDEPGETVTVAGTLSGVTVTGTSVTITDDDALPVLSIDSPTVTEGNAATVTLRYTVSLSPASGRSVTVAYADTGTGTATSATDYAAVTAGTLAFAAGETSKTLDVTVDGDATDEANETVVLRLSAPVNATLSNGGASLDATGTITDDDAAPAVSVADADAVAEGDDPDTTADMSFAVALSAASGRIVTVPYTLGGTAKAGADYAGDASGTLTIAPGNAGGSIVVAVKGDVVDEPNETVVVTLGVPTNATVSTAEGAGTAEGEITDDEATPTATLTLAPAAIDESGATNASTVTAALSGASSEVVTLAVSTSGAAHTLSQGKTLTIAAGEKASTGTVTVTATDNDVDAAADATVTVSATASGGGVAAPADVTLTVRDDDVRAVRVSKSTVTVREADDAVTADVAEHEATYTVVLDSEPTGGTVTVNVASGAAGTATVSPASLEFDATDWSTAQVVTVTGVDDDVHNAGGKRAATITHTVSASGTDYAGVTAAPVSVTVNDDDGPPTGIDLSADVATVAESDGAVVVTVTATVTGGSTYSEDRVVRVSIGNSGDSAGEGADYAQVGDLTITVPAHQRTAVDTFDLDPAEDVIHEGAETLSLRGESSGITVNPTSIAITDNDAAPSGIALSADPNSVAENVQLQTVEVTATVTGGTTYASATAVSVSVGNSTDSAVAGSDYRAVGDFTITVPAGAASATGSFDLRPVDDGRDEDDKTISLTAASGNLTVTGTTLGLTDDDEPPVVSISAGGVSEGAGGEITRMRFTVRLSAASDKPVSVSYADAGSGSATWGADYEAITGGTLSFAPGDTERTIEVRILTDSDDEGDETVVLRLSSPSNATLEGGGASLDATGTISDGPELNISKPNPRYVAEGQTVMFTITAERPPTSDLRVNLWVTDRTADLLEPADEGDQQVWMRAGEISTTFSLVIARDNVDEPRGNVFVELRRGRGYQLGEKLSAIVVVDDDLAPIEPAPGPIIGIAGGDAIVEGGTARFTLRANPAPEAVLSLNLVVSQQGGFVPASGLGDHRISFPAGETTHTFDLSTENDGDDEADGAVSLALAAGKGYRIDSSASSASVTIADNDATPISLSRKGSGAIPENGGSEDIRVTLGRSLEAGESVTVPLDVGGATQGIHYQLALVNAGQGVLLLVSSPHSEQNPALAFNGPSEREATLRVTAAANSDDEARTLEFDYGTGGREPSSSGLSGGVTATGGGIDVPIAAADAELSIAPARAAEGSELEFVVRLPDPAPAGGVTIDYETLDGSGDSGDPSHRTATSVDDYQGASSGASITIPIGRRSGSIRIATIDDDVYEGDHYFRVRLTQASPFSPGSVDTAIGTIEDGSDRPAFSFTDASFEVDEGEGAATLTVERSGDALAPATVEYATSGGNAEAGSDYVSVRGELVFNPGDSVLSFEVPIVDDGLDEGPEGFRATIATDRHGVPGALVEADVRILDNDPTRVGLSFGSGATSEIEEGAGSNEIMVSLARQLEEGEELSVPLSFGGTAELGVDYALSAPTPWPPGVSYSNLDGGREGGPQPPETAAAVAQGGPVRFFTASSDAERTSNAPTIIFTGDAESASEAPLMITPLNDVVTDERREAVVVELGDLGPDATPDLDGDGDGDGNIRFEIVNFNQFLPVISLSAEEEDVTEGEEIVLTVTADFPEAAAADASATVYVALIGFGEFWPAESDVNPDRSVYRTPVLSIGQPTATIRVATDDDLVKERDGLLAALVTSSDGYHLPEGDPGHRVRIEIRDNDDARDDDEPPEVSIVADAASIAEGATASFTVRATRVSDADLTVTLAVSEAAGGDHVAADDEGVATVVIPGGKTRAAFSVATVDDAVDEPDGAVTAAVAAGGGYRVAAAPGDAATVGVSDDDATAGLVLSVDDATAKEGASPSAMEFTVRLSAAAQTPVRVYVATRPSSPVSARPKKDYWPGSYALTFRPGETSKQVYILIYNDSHDEDPETFEVVLSDASGASIADGVAVGTIVNDDPMPAAWLSRFGRTVAEQALDGIAGRMAAPRTPGMQGTLAGQALIFDAPAANDDAGPGAVASGAPAPGGTGSPAPADIARGFDSRPERSGHGDFGTDFGETQAQPRTMTMREALLGSSFTLTGKQDSSGGTGAFWGRAAQGSFAGREGTLSLDGEVTTAMLGADYARDRWLVGLVLAQSTGEGGYADSGDGGSGACPDGMDAATRALCNGAVRGGDGKVEASLTAAIPYASLQASERLGLWGALGYGSGEVTLKPALGDVYRADTTWRMAAAGLRGDLLAPESGAGPALALTSDALWARTSSEKTRDLAASESDATRLRLGLEGSYRFAMEGGGALVPKLEVGARHDGGDAETGFGVELGGGLAWSDAALGLSLDVSGRTLLAHENDDLKDRGYAASLGFDPDPGTERGPSASLRQEFGGQAAGGLDALFAPDPLDERTGGEATSRWTAEAAYGFPAFGGRYTANPHAGLGFATGARDYTLGWRWTPEENAPDLSFGLRAARRESGAAAPEHSVGFEVRARW